MNSDFYSLSKDAKKLGIVPLISNGNDHDKILSYSKKNKGEICFCIGWSHLLPQRLIGFFNYGVIGFHPSKLPYNKGRHPVIWALFLGLSETASSFFLMDISVDGGKILSQKNIKISKKDNANMLIDKITVEACKQIKAFVPKYIDGSLKNLDQSKNKGNTWRKRSFKDGVIDWRMSYDAISNLVKLYYQNSHFYQ